MKEIQIEAFDTVGNKFKKTAKIIELNQKEVLDLGYPIQYYLSSLISDYPFTENFCIDAMGRNHKGHPVYISPQDMNMLLEAFV